MVLQSVLHEVLTSELKQNGGTHACLQGLFNTFVHFVNIYNGFSGSVILSSTERNKLFFNTGKTLPKEACQHFYSWISGIKLIYYIDRSVLLINLYCIVVLVLFKISFCW